MTDVALNGVDHARKKLVDQFALALAANDTSSIDRVATEARAAVGSGESPLAIPIRRGSEYTFPPPRRQWVSPYLAIAPGRPTMFCAPPGVGKGWLCQLLQWCVAGNLPFGELERLSEPGPTMWLDYEEGDEELWRRHARMRIGFQPDDIDDSTMSYVDCTLEPNRTLNDPQFVTWLTGALKGHRLCIIDNLTECFSAEDRNSADARAPIKIMNELSLRTGCAFAVIYHPRKSKQDDSGLGQDAVRGSSAIVGSCGSVWIGRASPDRGATRWTHEKCNGRAKSEPFDLSWQDTDDGGIVIHARRAAVGSTQPSYADRAVEFKAAIRVALAKGPLGANQLEHACREAGLEFNASAFRCTRDAMVDAGELNVSTGKNNSKAYRLPGDSR